MKRHPLGLILIFLLIISCSSDVYRFKLQKLTLKNFITNGRILDISGGTDGVIARLKGDQLVAIDLDIQSLEELPAGPLKIIMDPRNLKFLDNTFETATAFFAFLNWNDRDHQSIFQEMHRVLKPGGIFLIWDAILPVQDENNKKFAFLPIQIKLPNEELKTGFTVTWPEKDHHFNYFKSLSEKTGFKIIRQEEKGMVLFLELKKE